MSRLRFLLVATFFGICSWAVAEEGKLRSVLVGNDDLRPLIDLNPPTADSILSNAPAEKLELSPAVVSSAEYEPSAADVATEPSENSTPAPTPAPASATASSTAGTVAPTESQPNSPKREAVSSNPLFDFGVAATSKASEVVIRGVYVDTPAHRLRLIRGDVITGIDGKSLSTREFQEALREKMVSSEPFLMQVRRGDKQYRLRVNIAASPANAVAQTSRQPARRQTSAQRVSQQRRPNRTSAQRVSTSSSQVASQPQARPANQPAATSTPNPARAQAAATATVRQSNQPVIGAGGRILGNRRVINSARRLFGR